MDRRVLIADGVITIALMGLGVIHWFVGGGGFVFVMGVIFVFAGLLRDDSERRLEGLGLWIHLCIVVMILVGWFLALAWLFYLGVPLIVASGFLYHIGRKWYVIRVLGWVFVFGGMAALLYFMAARGMVKFGGVVIWLPFVVLRVYDLLLEVGRFLWLRRINRQ